MTYRLYMSHKEGDHFPDWWPNYLTETDLWGNGTENLQKHLLLNHNCQYHHTHKTYERWLEFQSESDAVLFLLKYS